MKPTEFLIDQLKQLVENFNGIRIKYELNKYTGTHIIQILPPSYFKDDIACMKMKRKIEIKFEKKYPNEDILFVSEGSLIEIGNENILFDSEKSFLKEKINSILFTLEEKPTESLKNEFVFDEKMSYSTCVEEEILC
ncbi:MAG: hypothetical protein WC223_13565 [Bacteroidales bacterium]|jgi:hypothetical protein